MALITNGASATAATNSYATIEQLKAALSGIDDTADDDALNRALNVASRQIDRFCGRRFWEDAADTTRYYTAQSSKLLILHGQPEDVDLTSLTTLKVDPGGDGTYETTWTVTTDYVLEPRNATTNSRPYTQVRVAPASGKTFPAVANGVELTGTFGWSAVPDEVQEACLRQASEVFKTVSEAPFGVAQVGFDGSLSGPSRFLQRDVQLMLRPYMRTARMVA